MPSVEERTMSEISKEEVEELGTNIRQVLAKAGSLAMELALASFVIQDQGVRRLMLKAGATIMALAEALEEVVKTAMTLAEEDMKTEEAAKEEVKDA